MSKTNLLKGLVVIVLSAILVANLTSLVFADDNSFDNWDTPVTTNDTVNNTITNDVSNDVSNTVSNTSTNDWSGTIETNTNSSAGNATTSLNTDDEEDNEVNSLAYTGIEDTNILAILAVLGVIVAGYSFKKIKEYDI